MSEAHARAGRLGALTRMARGTTNTAAASAAFMARFEREVDPHGVLDPKERAKRAAAAKSLYFTRLAQRRHAS